MNIKASYKPVITIICMVFFCLPGAIADPKEEDEVIRQDASNFYNSVKDRLEEMGDEEKQKTGKEALNYLKALKFYREYHIYTACDLIELLAKIQYKDAESILLEILNNSHLADTDGIELRLKASSALIRFGSEMAYEAAFHYVLIVDEWCRLHGYSYHSVSPCLRMPWNLTEPVMWGSHDDRMIPIMRNYIYCISGQDEMSTKIIYAKMKKGDYGERQLNQIVDILWEELNSSLLPDTMWGGAFWVIRILICNWDMLDETQKVGIKENVAYWSSEQDKNGEKVQIKGNRIIPQERMHLLNASHILQKELEDAMALMSSSR